MTYRRAIFLATTAISISLVTVAVVSRARQPDRSATTGKLVAAETSPRPAATNRRANRPARLPSVLIRGVPHVRQKPDFCGEACAAMFLGKDGWAVDQDYVFQCSGLDPVEGRGCHTRELVAALKTLGREVGPVWFKIPAAESDKSLDRQWQALHADLVNGVGTIICMRTGEGPGATEHFRLILGYDDKRDEVIYHEPAEDRGAYRRMDRATLLKLWPLKYAADTWTVIRIPLRQGWMGASMVPPGTPKPAGASGTFTPADYTQHVMKLKKKIPHQGFTIVLQPPFVVIGDEQPETVRRRAVGTVKWAVDKLKKSYFTKDPDEILDIWLFKDKPSYEHHTATIFRTKPSTPFGYFSHVDRALVMNISTGGGTLVHEIVHPFVASNFPECPSWLNEGLGSLYEQSAERGGRIVGLTNWRLAGLQRAIRQGQVPSFETLCSTTTRQFYDEDPGTNYAQARYLCYYLQEKGLLEKFYHRFFSRQESDPTGYQTLQEVLGRPDMTKFKKQWEAYVMGLHFP